MTRSSFPAGAPFAVRLRYCLKAFSNARRTVGRSERKFPICCTHPEEGEDGSDVTIRLS
jgi:hypothetical protein